MARKKANVSYALTCGLSLIKSIDLGVRPVRRIPTRGQFTVMIPSVRGRGNVQWSPLRVTSKEGTLAQLKKDAYKRICNLIDRVASCRPVKRGSKKAIRVWETEIKRLDEELALEDGAINPKKRYKDALGYLLIRKRNDQQKEA